MDFFKLSLGIFCVWRITHLLHAEEGPWKIFSRLRSAMKPVFGELFDCFYCLSLWVSAPFTWLLGSQWKEWLLLWPALSAGAILIERVTEKQFRLQDYYAEDREDRHVLR